MAESTLRKFNVYDIRWYERPLLDPYLPRLENPSSHTSDAHKESRSAILRDQHNPIAVCPLPTSGTWWVPPFGVSRDHCICER